MEQTIIKTTALVDYTVRTLVQSDNFFYVLTYYDVMCHFLRTATRVTPDIKTGRLSTRSSQQRPSL
jgi:hypothetical protein